MVELAGLKTYVLFRELIQNLKGDKDIKVPWSFSSSSSVSHSVEPP